MTGRHQFKLGLLLSLCLTASAYAEGDFTYHETPGCVLHKFENGAWGTGTATELEGQKFPVKPYGKYGTQWSAKVNGIWYYADKGCFQQEGAPATEASPTPTPAETTAQASPSPAPAQNTSAKKVTRKAAIHRKKYSFDYAISYWKPMGASTKAGSTDFVATTATYSGTFPAQSSLIGGRIRFTYLLKPEHELNFGFGYTTGSRKSTSVSGGTASSSSTIAETFYDTELSAGYRYLFGSSNLVPFLGAQLTYNMLYQKETIDIGSGSGAGVGYSASAIGYGLVGGSYYYLNEKWRLLGEIVYSVASGKTKISDTTEDASFPKGSAGNTLNLTHIGINLGIGLCF